MQEPAPQPKKLVLFIDAQNVYKGARDAFFDDEAPNQDGQIDPWKVGQLLVEKQESAGYPTVLEEVRIYTGYHSPEYNQRGYDAYQRQSAAWKKSGCKVFPRVLRYDPTGESPPREKGVDVQLAIDYVRLAIDDDYDVGVIFSNDTDLLPAIEFVLDRYMIEKLVHTATWSSDSSGKALWSEGAWVHYLKRDDYDKCHDSYNYAPETQQDMIVRLQAKFGTPPSN